MECLTSLNALVAKLDEAKQKKKISDDAFRQTLSGWYLSPKVFGECPQDPLSAEYKSFQLGIYERLTNHTYHVANEKTDFILDHELQWPYPYGTKSAQTVGAHLLGYGWLIQKMNLPPDSHILEIGSGYGALTVHLARMGYQVTCLDVSEPLLNFVKMRTAEVPQQIKTICGDMATVSIPEQYDAVIFNASLHHSVEHRSVIDRLDSLLLPNGVVAFASEPIWSRKSKVVPYPWGIRLDGLSIWSICEWGWLELGFQENYFVQLINNAGFHLTRYTPRLAGTTDIWLARKEKRSHSLSNIIHLPFKKYDLDVESELIRLRMLGLKGLQLISRLRR